MLRRVIAAVIAGPTVVAVPAAAHAEETEAGWWQPAPGKYSSWDWQITQPYDLSEPRAMYDLDLFDLAPEGSELRYDDGEVIELEAGPLAGMVNELHERSPSAIVICYLDTGAYEHYRPDARRFPGYHDDVSAIPNRPEGPEAGSVIGWDTGWDGERWLDIREGSRDAFAGIMWARLDLARDIGCDGVEPDQNNSLDNDPGFPVTLEDQHSWYREVAEQAHARGLSVGMKNGHDQPGSTEVLVDAFDWALPEECVEFDECGELSVFIEHGKAVFAVDYRDAVDTTKACEEHRRWGLDGLIKDEPPSGDRRVPCAGDDEVAGTGVIGVGVAVMLAALFAAAGVALTRASRSATR